jgi:hypothetical protein
MVIATRWPRAMKAFVAATILRNRAASASRLIP